MGMDSEPETLTLEYDEWRDLLAAASVLDLIHGGYFRARPREIEFYCGPENAPSGWRPGSAEDEGPETRVTVGVAELVGPIGADGVEIRLRVTNWSALRELRAALARGAYLNRPEQFTRDEEAALRGRPEEWDWLRLQFRKLRDHAAGSILTNT
jgi:hypothetical protein